MRMGKKGLGLNELVTVVLAFLLIGVVGAIGLYITNSINITAGFSYPNGSTAVGGYALSFYAVTNATTGMATLLSWLPIIAIIVAAGVVISVLVSAFVFKGREGI
jgi:hypothetical protein